MPCAQAFKCYEQVRGVVGMNDSQSSCHGSTCDELLRVVDDIESSELRDQGSRFYEQLKAMIDMNDFMIRTSIDTI